MQCPLVSIITPTFNRAHFLQETIRSVLAQDYPNIEYIVLDDGSTDDTRQLLEKYEDRLSWFHHPNQGEALTVNRGFELCRGEIVCVLSSDDPMMPGAVSAGVAALQANPNAVAAYPDWLVIDEDGLIITEVRVRDYSFPDMVRLHDCIPGPSTFFRRNLLSTLGGRDLRYRYVGDYDFWLRAALQGTLVRIPGFFGCYRRHAGAITLSEQSDLMASEHVEMIENFYAGQVPDSICEVKREALASAHFVGGCLAGPGFQVRWRHFSRSARLASWRLMRCPNRIPIMAVLLLESFEPIAWLRRILVKKREMTPLRGKHYSLLSGHLL